MTTNVYWACLENEWMLAREPEPVINNFYKNIKIDKNNSKEIINYCPAFNDNLKNVYSMKSLYNYDFFIKEDEVCSNKFDQFFFDNHVSIRSIKNKFFGFYNRYIFFTDSDSLMTTFYEFPFLEDNNITNRCVPIPGKYDIGKWFRNTEFSFYLKKDFNEFKIEQGEIYSYIRFHTKEKINFTQFKYTKNIEEYQMDGYYLNNFHAKMKSLENYYKNFRVKKKILNEIKKEII
jgi:hypothetical protein